MDTRPHGLSFVVPVYNGARTLDEVLHAITRAVADDPRPVEVLVVDDRSSDASREIIERYLPDPRVRLLDGHGRGAAAAINRGVAAARFEWILQVDQDVIIDAHWLPTLTAALERRPEVAAAQARYRWDRADGPWARVMGLDLAQRHAALEGDVDHVCTGNTAYRASALMEAGPFDESMGYGFDNCMSYRLVAGGRRLAHCSGVSSLHRWRPTLRGYLSQQYGVAYGRLDLIRKYPERFTGDQVSGPGMILHAALTCAALALLAAAALAVGVGASAWWFAPGGVLFAALASERLVAGMRAGIRYRDPAGLLFPLAHTLRDLAWALAVLRFSARALAGQASHPALSMGRVKT